jgi:hypothetical protein
LIIKAVAGGDDSKLHMLGMVRIDHSLDTLLRLD